MSTKKTILIISGLLVLAIGLTIVLNMNLDTEKPEMDGETIDLKLECPDRFSEGEVITLKVLDGESGLENVSVYIEDERYGATNRHGNLVIQAPSSSFETEFRYDGEFMEADKNEC